MSFIKRIKYNWYKGRGAIKNGDVLVFNQPQYSSLNDKYPNLYGYEVIKRCFGVPGDTIIIHIERISKEEKLNFMAYQPNVVLFPFDSALNWTIDNYGPLRVPGEGKQIHLDSIIISHYKDVILYEGGSIETDKNSVFSNGKYSKNYVFRNDYYFMTRDNFYNSVDSRYWGFVPRTHIIGKAVLVLFSFDPNQPWYRSFKWKRFLKRIK